MVKSLLLSSTILLLSSCSYIESQLGLEEDNFGEELIEFGIKTQLGVDIDLTPNSPE